VEERRFFVVPAVLGSIRIAEHGLNFCSRTDEYGFAAAQPVLPFAQRNLGRHFEARHFTTDMFQVTIAQQLLADMGSCRGE
jgi:hypothetical protein